MSFMERLATLIAEFQSISSRVMQQHKALQPMTTRQCSIALHAHGHLVNQSDLIRCIFEQNTIW